MVFYTSINLFNNVHRNKLKSNAFSLILNVNFVSMFLLCCKTYRFGVPPDPVMQRIFKDNESNCFLTFEFLNHETSILPDTYIM